MRVARAETGWTRMPKPQSKKTEVVAAPENDRLQRRRFSVGEKRRILDEAAACTEYGELAALLRREGIYSSLLYKWRRQMEARGEEGLAAQKAGRKPIKDDKDREIEKLKKKAARLEKNLDLARKLIELQKKAHEILGIALPRIEEDEEP
jgi:transposase-like protein